MNRENVLYMKKVMMSAENLDMTDFRGSTREECDSIEKLHSCGNTACFAGYMALSEKFQKEGGDVHWLGNPILFEHDRNKGVQTYFDAEAVAKWLGISSLLANKIVFDQNRFYKHTFGVEKFRNVKPEHLVQVMDMILDGELQ